MTRPVAHGIGNLVVCSEADPDRGGLTRIATPFGYSQPLGTYYDPWALKANLDANRAALDAAVARLSTGATSISPSTMPSSSSAGSSMALVPYTYRSRDGTLKTIQLGAWNLDREVAAIRACEAQGPVGVAGNGGVGTADTVNCYQALLAAAGGPNTMTEAPPPGTGLAPVWSLVAARAVTTGGVGQPAVGGAGVAVPASIAVAPIPATASVSQAAAIGSAVSGVSNFSPFDTGGVTLNGGGSVAYLTDPRDRLPTTGGYETGVGGPSTSILGTIGDVIGDVVRTAADPNVLAALAKQGIIRGSVGKALGYVPPAKVAGGTSAVAGLGFSAADLQNIILRAAQEQMPAPGQIGDVLEDPIGTVQSAFTGGRPVIRPNLTNSPELFRVGRQSPYLARRILVDLPDGGIGVLVNMGRLMYGSRELSYAKSVAKRNGMVVKRRACGCSGGGRRRRGGR